MVLACIAGGHSLEIWGYVASSTLYPLCAYAFTVCTTSIAHSSTASGPLQPPSQPDLSCCRSFDPFIPLPLDLLGSCLASYGPSIYSMEHLQLSSQSMQCTSPTCRVCVFLAWKVCTCTMVLACIAGGHSLEIGICCIVDPLPTGTYAHLPTVCVCVLDVVYNLSSQIQLIEASVCVCSCPTTVLVPVSGYICSDSC